MKTAIRIVILAGVIAALASCATYSKIESNRQWVKDISVEPSTAWNKVPFAPSGTVQWTQDGQLLNSVTFISGILPGKPIFKVSKRAEFGLFRADMLPNEIMELTESSLSKAYSTTLFEASDLKPARFGDTPGFRFSYRYVRGDDDVERIGVAAGAVKKDKLYLILCEGTSLVYYERIAEDAERILATAQIR